MEVDVTKIDKKKIKPFKQIRHAVVKKHMPICYALTTKKHLFRVGALSL
jgi:hypothetical protein